MIYYILHTISLNHCQEKNVAYSNLLILQEFNHDLRLGLTNDTVIYEEG